MSAKPLICEIIKQNATEKEILWLNDKVKSDSKTILTAFVATPRFIRKTIIETSDNSLAEPVPGWCVKGWSLDRLVRIYLLLHLSSEDKTSYFKNIETLFETGEINELVSLYSALSVLDFTEDWVFRATEAVRSNIGFVFDAIAFGNPYPARYFSDPAWNQLVLKCIFNDKPVHLILGLEERANLKLAETLSDFAHERWAAGRKVPAQVWRLVSKFVNETILKDLIHLFESNDKYDRMAAALVCSETNFEPAHSLLNKFPELKQGVQNKVFSWTELENL